MRLLAYGGTGYYERQRIGAWENAPRDALDDSFRLEEEQMTFGLCLIEKEPVLVIRQLQVTKTGRAYAYSLLLDPGASVWQGFGWNAAELADALFDETIETSRLLLEQPEKLNAQDLEEVFDSLTPKADHRFERSLSEVVNDYEAAWIGAFFTPSISSWPPKVFGFVARPNFVEISALLWRLPPCFRAGLGWLIGSSGQSARNFGAQFSIDDRADVDYPMADLIAQGRQLHGALQALSDDDEFAETADRLIDRPVWEWADDATENPAPMAERLTIISALLTAVPERDDILQMAVENLPQTDFLKVELRRAWQRAAFSRGKMLTPEQTSFALDNCLDCDVPLREDNIPWLDETTLVERFVTDGLEPSNSNVPHLPLAARYKVWSALLLQTREHEDVPGIFFRAIEDIEEESETGRHVASLIQELSARMTNDKSFSLLFWQRYRNKGHWVSVKQMLRDLARDRAVSHNRDWQLEYLLFAEDDGADWLIHQPTSNRDWREMIKLFVNLVQTNQEHAEPARRWLQALADSGFRTMDVLNCEDKLLISKTVGGRWISYIDLWDRYNNQIEGEPARSPLAKERQILLKELDDLIHQKPLRDSVPDLNGLETMLGSLPSQAMAYFQGLSPNLSKPADASKWVSAWGSIDSKRASKETVRYFLESDGVAFSDYWLKPEFEEKEMEILFSTLMFRETPTRSKRYQRRLRELLTKAQAQGAKRILNVVRQIFKDGIENEAQARVFCQRFADDRDALEALLGCLPKTTSGIALTEALYKSNAAHFVTEASNVWRTVINRNAVLTPYQYSLMFHLRKRKGARVQVGRALEDDYPGELIKLRLEEILKRGIEAGSTPDQFEEPEDFVEEVEETTQPRSVDGYEPEGHSVGGWVKNFLGVGSARKARSEDHRPGEIFRGLASPTRSVPEEENSPDDSDPLDRQRSQKRTP